MRDATESLPTGASTGGLTAFAVSIGLRRPTSGSFLRLLVLHDDGEREFAYTTRAEQALEQATRDGWTVVSVKDDWATVL